MEVICKAAISDCVATMECDGGKPHDPSSCQCLTCPYGNHIAYTTIKDPPKPSWPCQHGEDCICGNEDRRREG